MERRQFLFASMAAAATVSARGTASEPTPGTEWSRRKPPRPAAALEALLAGLDTTALMVIHRGSIIYSRGDEAHLSYVASARKSLVSMTYGPAVDRGVIDPDATLESWASRPRWLLPMERTATIRQLLMARSGVYHRPRISAMPPIARRRAAPCGPASTSSTTTGTSTRSAPSSRRLTGRGLYQAFRGGHRGPDRHAGLGHRTAGRCATTREIRASRAAFRAVDSRHGAHGPAHAAEGRWGAAASAARVLGALTTA